MTDREIEEQLKEALVALEAQWREEEDDFDLSLLSLDRSPTIEDVGRAIAKTRATAALFRQQADTLSSYARDLDEWIEPLQGYDLRDLVREQRETAALLLIGSAYVLSDGEEDPAIKDIAEAIDGVSHIFGGLEFVSDVCRGLDPVTRRPREAG